MRILLLSAYDAHSHQQWRSTLESSFNEYDWTVLSLPPRYFNWRVRGNSLSWAWQQRDTLEKSYDLLIATSMVDLSALRGFVPSLAHIPSLVYFHENQFAYPTSDHQQASVEPQVLNLYTALAADKLAFNSRYNLETFIEGCRELLMKLPDHVPSGLVEGLQAKAVVLPVPLPESCFTPGDERDPSKPLQLLWNHRWEYDKGPDRLFAAVNLLLASGVEFDFHIVGQQFRSSPTEFAELEKMIGLLRPGALKHFGYIEDVSEYRQLLRAADVVMSTAMHDFQGLSVLEAVAAGCIPVLPNRLCYSEWVDESFLYSSFPTNIDTEASVLSDRLLGLATSKDHATLPTAPNIEYLGINSLRPKYQQLFAELLNLK